SSVWVGTPLYILGETRNHRWSLVVTPEFIGWVQSKGIARTNEAFVNRWKEAAKKNLVAIIRSETAINDETGQFRFTAYVGSFFPAESESSGFRILLPVADMEQQALIKYGTLSTDTAVQMPLSATPQHFSEVMRGLIGRPYGWGGMYFYNDCSAELKYLLAPFGIWLPRHSSYQVYAGKMVDMSSAPRDQRLAYLMAKGHRFLTLVYIGGHIFLYVGNYPNPNDKDHGLFALSYQNMWGLSPNPPTRRAVIGKAVLFPLLLEYPEDGSLTSLVDKKFFQVSYLDELPNFVMKLQKVDLRMLMSEVLE
ncbi:MAG TPA: SH3 domain-containing protein, partial [Gammaproteobacteria bacterium]|nr:SH3 domain-containing protein [Gammaproteobacteria bacterium]